MTDAYKQETKGWNNRIVGHGEESPDQLVANPLNYRLHPKFQQDALLGTINQVGYIRSVTVNERTGFVVDGHLRVLLALRTGQKKIPVEYVDLSEEEERLILATLDPLAGLAVADAEMLEDLLGSIETEDEAINEMLAQLAEDAGIDFGDEPPEDPGPQIDRAEELREKWGVELGQLWRIPSKTADGEHWIICGDCTDAAVVERVMGGADGTLVSDPPYGIGYDYDLQNDSDNGENKRLVMSAFDLAPEPKIWTCGLMNLGRDLSWNLGAKVLCWHKGFAQAGNGLGGASTWEPILVVGVKGGTLPNDYIHIGTERVEGLGDLHPCPKPVSLFFHLIEHLASGVVYDPFLGSGTTMVACERLGRLGRGIEISPAYCAVALQRLADMGLDPVLEVAT